MDQLKAYEILELNENASVDDIKEAYARLSKQYHPEEYPEKFQSIHEAYSVLVRNNRRQHRSTHSSTPTSQTQKIPTQVKEDQYEWKEETVEEDKELDFVEAENRALQQEKQRLHVITVQALEEFRTLLKPQYCHQLKKFKEFFHNENYTEILRSDEFMVNLAELLSHSVLKKNIYDYIIDFYRLRGLDSASLIPEMQALYRVLDKKRGMNARNKENATRTTIPFILMMAIYRSLRSSARALDNTQSFFALVFIGLLLLLGYKLYQRIYENHSCLFSQAVVLLLSIVLHVIVILFGLYGFVFGDVDLGNIFAFFFILIAFIWLMILGFIALIKKIKRI